MHNALRLVTGNAVLLAFLGVDGRIWDMGHKQFLSGKTHPNYPEIRIAHIQYTVEKYHKQGKHWASYPADPGRCPFCGQDVHNLRAHVSACTHRPAEFVDKLTEWIIDKGIFNRVMKATV